MRKEYLISINLYGTLLDDDNKINDYTIKVINACKINGAKILINTSHSYSEALEYVKLINPDFISCFNGNYIISESEIYKSNPISLNASKNIIDIIKKQNDYVILECIDGAYRNRPTKYNFIKSIYSDIDKIDLSNCFSIIIPSDDIDYLDDACLKYNLDLNYNNFGKYYIITPKSNKSNAIYILNKYFNNKYKIISFGNNRSDYETLKISDIGIKMQNSTDLDNINFWTASNNEDGVAKFLNNFYNLDMKVDYNNVKILDCTLRDGGHLNNCNFGYKNIRKIIKNLLQANTDIIEIGFLEDCNYDKNKTKFNKVEDAENLLNNINCNNSDIALLVQVDKYDIKKLETCEGKIKMIRVSFHKELLATAIRYCKIIKERGYICSINPINFSGYDNFEIVNLIKKVNKLDIDYFSIVDTFGLLLNNDFSNKLNLINNLLRKDINVGLHLHDNLSSAFSTAQILMKKNSRFGNVIIDSSLLGMGRDPGNLKTELIMYYLNIYNKEKYNMSYIYNLIENEISNFKKIYNWNQDFSYSISAFEKVHRTYAEYLKNKNLDYSTIEKFIKKIPKSNKVKYKENIIEKILINEGEL